MLSRCKNVKTILDLFKAFVVETVTLFLFIFLPCKQYVILTVIIRPKLLKTSPAFCIISQHEPLVSSSHIFYFRIWEIELLRLVFKWALGTLGIVKSVRIFLQDQTFIQNLLRCSFRFCSFYRSYVGQLQGITSSSLGTTEGM